MTSETIRVQPYLTEYELQYTLPTSFGQSKTFLHGTHTQTVTHLVFVNIKIILCVFTYDKLKVRF